MVADGVGHLCLMGADENSASQDPFDPACELAVETVASERLRLRVSARLSINSSLRACIFISSGRRAFSRISSFLLR